MKFLNSLPQFFLNATARKMVYLSIVVSVLSVFCVTCQSTPASPNLIPYPQEITFSSGQLTFTDYMLRFDDEFSQEAQKMEQYLSDQANIPRTNQNPQTVIILKKDAVKNPHPHKGAYSLTISDSIMITAPEATGIFYAFQTLKQLIARQSEKISIPKCMINDWAAFKIRGYMQDVGRNYQPVSLLKEQLDIMAFYKMNLFHFHLSENQAFRLEIKSHPELTDPATMTRQSGKYYTQEEFKDLVRYAAARHITIIPEIDMPGHALAFRKALQVETMQDPKVQSVMLDVIDELCAMVSADTMPYIHLGTDEVWHKEEKPTPDFLPTLFNRIRSHGREVVAWVPGQHVAGDSTRITQLWVGTTKPRKGHRYIDSRGNYLNHLDPLAGIGQLYLQQPCRTPHGNDWALGGILCCWHDNRVATPIDIFRQNPVYPGLVTYSEATWRGVASNNNNEYWAKLPPSHTREYNDFIAFENRLIAHRDQYFTDKPFPYIQQAHIPWRIIGAFDHNNDFTTSFLVEDTIQSSYTVNGKTYQWADTLLYGGTIHLKHFFGYKAHIEAKQGTVYALCNIHSPKEQTVGFWIGFNNWSRSGGRRGGPAPKQGEWHYTHPKIWVNKQEIAPPRWDNPEVPVKSSELPFTNEDYYYRAPTMIPLRKGKNVILLKIPFGKPAWKWMFTCVPVQVKNGQVREVPDLQFDAMLK